MARSRFSIALPSIIAHLKKTSRFFSREQLAEIFFSQREVWRLPGHMTLSKFIDELIGEAGFQEIEVKFDAVGRHAFTFGEITDIELSAGIFPKGYLSHYSAVYLIGLTEQIPKRIYVTNEQSKKSERSHPALLQENVDNAFKKPQRISESKMRWNGTEIVLLKGKHTGNLGVVPASRGFGVRHTNLERTLIDIAVRPSYSGGVFEVLKAYRTAAEFNVSVNRLSGYLSKLNYIYPYHQVIGFYMEASGVYRDEQIAMFQGRPMSCDFYLTYNMQEMDYSEKWKLYYPKGML